MESALLVEKLLKVLELGGPWAVVFFIWWKGQEESQQWKDQFQAESHKWEERFQAMKSMYENNVNLVKGYEKLANEQQDMVIMNTQATTKLITIIEERIP